VLLIFARFLPCIAVNAPIAARLPAVAALWDAAPIAATAG